MNQPNETRNGWKNEGGKDALKRSGLYVVAKRESSHNHEDTKDEENEGYKKTSFVDWPNHSQVRFKIVELGIHRSNQNTGHWAHCENGAQEDTDNNEVNDVVPLESCEHELFPAFNAGQHGHDENIHRQKIMNNNEYKKSTREI